MVARLENTLKSVMLSGQDWMFRKPGGERRCGKDTRLKRSEPVQHGRLTV